ncbi:MAG TPA: aldehyde dehydrogenase family protein [Thermoanaerobaculia bacterium]|nr:aldehyde dehydrogenase family protein [Thermoanaerobaculia bacterium]
MTIGSGFKITYSTLAQPAEEVHQAFENAATQVRAGLGGEVPFFVDGEAVETTARIEGRSPIDERVAIAHFASAGREHVAAAIAAANRAFPAWRDTPWRERVRLLRGAADLIGERRFEIAALMAFEVGKTRFESLADAEEAADLLRYYCQCVEDADGFERPMGSLQPGERTLDVLRPYGAWMVISPFNFPLALAAGMAAGALVGGNTVVIKPATAAAATGLELYRALADAGLPHGVVNLVTGPGPAVGEELAANDGVAGLVFTGSKEVGLRLWRDFNRNWPRPTLLEVGGKNPTVVSARADPELAAEGTARAAFGFGGQKCSACSRVYVEEAVAAAFEELLLEKTRALRLGDPLERDTYLGPVIDAAAVRRFERAAELARRDGRVLCGGAVRRDGDLSRGHFVEPTIVTGLPRDHELLHEELFLPFLCLERVPSFDEAITRANRTEYGLTAGVYSRDAEELQRFFGRIEAGVTYANRRSGATTGAWPGVNPFCGWKASGSAGKGVCGPYYVQQFLREQSRTVME